MITGSDWSGAETIAPSNHKMNFKWLAYANSAHFVKFSGVIILRLGTVGGSEIWKFVRTSTGKG